MIELQFRAAIANEREACIADAKNEKIEVKSLDDTYNRAINDVVKAIRGRDV